jgi:hypothetical protein
MIMTNDERFHTFAGATLIGAAGVTLGLSYMFNAVSASTADITLCAIGTTVSAGVFIYSLIQAIRHSGSISRRGAQRFNAPAQP